MPALLVAKMASSTVSKTSPVGKRPVGRPTKYHPKYCAQVIAYMEAGGKRVVKPMTLSHGLQAGGEIVDHPTGKLPAFFQGFARKIKVAWSTLEEWRKVHPDFSDAWKDAKAIQLQQMVEGMLSGVYAQAGAIFALKNMHGWRDQTDVKHSGEARCGPLVELPAAAGFPPMTNGHDAPARRALAG